MSTGRKSSRTLGLLGPSWAASPARRLIQSVCLAGFLVLFFWVCWPYGSKEYARAFHTREVVDAELFLVLDPLVSISTTVAGRMLVWSLSAAAGVLLACLLFPRWFCGYACPLGTLFDVCDGFVGKWTRPAVTDSGTIRHRGSGGRGKRKLADGLDRSQSTHPPTLRPRLWWTNAKYYLLAAVMIAAACGVLLSGFVAAIPVLTRAMLFIAAPVQTGLGKGWYLVPSMNVGHAISIALVVSMFGLCLLGRRFWCSYVCPTGALLSLGSVLRLRERKITDACVKCGRCTEACVFAAIDDDFSTRPLNCTFCQTCAGVCPVGAIEFTWRWKGGPVVKEAETADLSRRGVLVGLGSAAAVGVGVPLAIRNTAAGSDVPIRPPGSVPEDKFLQLCVRCGECIKVCPNNVLQPAGFEQGFNGLWAPRVTPDWSGCEPSCNNCGQVCPTGAVRALDLEEKRAARIGLAEVDRATCLPHAGRGDCQLCVDECRMAGYDAIEFVRVGGQADESGRPIEGSGLLAPVVREDRCVGCGLCQMRCRSINVKSEKLLHRSAIRVVAGPGREDRIVSGSYRALREQRDTLQRQHQDRTEEASGKTEYLPDFLK